MVVDTIELDEDDEEKPEYVAEVTLDMMGVEEVGDWVDENE